MILWPSKDPDGIADYTFKFVLDEGDTIDSVLPADDATVAFGDVVIDSTAITGDNLGVAVTLSGGTASTMSIVNVRIQTTAGRTFDEAAVLWVVERSAQILGLFRIQFPDFAEVDDGTVDYWLQDASRVIDAGYGDDQNWGRMLYAAHYLTLFANTGTTESRRAQKFGGATRVKSGDLELQWTAPAAGTGVSSFDGSRYGAQLKNFVLAHRGGPRVTGTGRIPPQPRIFGS